MTDAVDHVLLTRFNLPSEGYERSVREREGWLARRVALFEQYCLPSVIAQTKSDFSWIVYFDPASPQWLRERIVRWSGEAPMTAIFRAEVSRGALLEDLSRVSGERHVRLITTNLDNDDAIAVDFIDRLQRAAVDAGPTALYFARGLIGAPPHVYRRIDRVNAFCSVSASWSDSTTCWHDWHNLLERHMQVRQVWGQPAWLQLVHGGNVSNRVHGTLVSPAEYTTTFPVLLEGWSFPTRGDRLLDSVLRRPARWGREIARGAVKEIIVAAAGRPALDRVRGRIRRGKGSPPSKEIRR